MKLLTNVFVAFNAYGKYLYDRKCTAPRDSARALTPDMLTSGCSTAVQVTGISASTALMIKAHASSKVVPLVGCMMRMYCAGLSLARWTVRLSTSASFKLKMSRGVVLEAKRPLVLTRIGTP